MRHQPREAFAKLAHTIRMISRVEVYQENLILDKKEEESIYSLDGELARSEMFP